jgi:hypothetical protein
MDGKGTALSAVDDYFAQRQTQGEDGPLIGIVRTVTVTLTSSPARPCIDVTSIPASTNEMGVFRAALAHLVRAYAGLDLFRIVTYDAGACSLDNAMAVREHNLHYVLGLTAGQPTLFEAAKTWLGVRPSATADAASTDQLSDRTVVRRIYIGAAVEVDSREGWETHLRTVLRVETETLDQKGNRTKLENRYLISSLANDRLSPEQWLLLVRRHWGVETTHQALDVAFKEDKHPWIKQSPRGMLVVAILRRVAYTLLSPSSGQGPPRETNRSHPGLTPPTSSTYRRRTVGLSCLRPRQRLGVEACPPELKIRPDVPERTLHGREPRPGTTVADLS